MPSESTERDLIYAGLEALRAAMPLALCAYIHQVTGEAPLLYMAEPRMQEIDPAEAFSLFTALRDSMDGGPFSGDDLHLPGYAAMAVSSIGSRSRGLHVIGRRAAPLDANELETFRRLATGLGAAVHILEEGIARQRMVPTEPIRVAVDLAEGRARAEVAIPLDEEIRTGSAESALAARAIVGAVIDATDASLKIVDVTTSPIGQDRGAMVLLEDGLGRRSLGASLIDDNTDELHATATAAMFAARTLARDEE